MATKRGTSQRRKSASKRPPWKKPAPKRAGHTKLTKKKKASAKAAAKRAGRPYPNLVDNMRAATKGKGRKTKKGKRSS